MRLSIMDAMGPSILTRTHVPGDGPPVRLRLARPADAAAVRELLARRGVEADQLDVRRLLAYDVAARTVLCACAFLDGAERVVGLGAIDLAPGADVDTLVCDEPETGALLAEVLRAQAHARARRAA